MDEGKVREKEVNDETAANATPEGSRLCRDALGSQIKGGRGADTINKHNICVKSLRVQWRAYHIIRKTYKIRTNRWNCNGGY